MRRPLSAILFLILSVCTVVSAVGRDEPVKATLESTHAVTLSSSAFEQDYRVRVALPYGYDSSRSAYPVVYLLDSDVLFGLVTDVSRLLPLEGVPIFLGKKRVPELIVVGIGYPGGVAEMSNKRGRDMNPPEGVEGDVNPDGATNFFRFLVGDLIPWVESNYRVDPSDRTLIGASRGGVFVLSTLFLHPETFRRHLAISPVIEPAIFDYAEAFANRKTAAQPRLYLSVGSEGEVEWGIATGVSKLTSGLEELDPARLDWRFEAFEGESHVSVVPKALIDGLVWAFSKNR